MDYWLDVFTEKSWQEFINAGSAISGFPGRMINTVNKIRTGDILLCYMKGHSSWFGALEVVSDKAFYDDKNLIWSDDAYPCRLKVRPRLILNPENGVPNKDLFTKLNLFKPVLNADIRAFGLMLRPAPKKLSKEDGEYILREIEARESSASDTERTKNNRTSVRDQDEIGYLVVGIGDLKGVKSETEQVDKPDDDNGGITPLVGTVHEEIQYTLLKLGADLGLDVWVAKNDKGKGYNGILFKDVPRLRDKLPTHFEESIRKIIDNIDVLWLEGDDIIKAFEVEHSTSIYSGLLRMADLISLRSNLNIDMYIVAPDERREKVRYEITRPTFKKLRPPLYDVCKFIPYSKLREAITKYGDDIKYFKLEFIDNIAEHCDSAR